MNLIETYNGSGFYAQYAESAVYDANGTPLTSYLTAVPAGTMNESAFSYDASDNITAYNGSAFKAGDEFPQSATEAIETVTANSADWNGTTETVSSNSGVWGGSALPISAGPGIKFEMVNETLVASTDETVLANNLVHSATTLTLSEPAGNFERLRLYDYYGTITEIQGNNARLSWIFDRTDPDTNTRMNRCYTITSNNGTTWDEVNVYSWNQNNYTGLTANGGTNWYLETVKVVGINRIAGGN